MLAHKPDNTGTTPPYWPSRNEKKRKEKKSFKENITQDIEFTLISKSPVYIQRIESVLELLLRREQGVD